MVRSQSDLTVRIDLANRFDLINAVFDNSPVLVVLRTLLHGVPSLDPMFMDLSDERTAIASQEDITMQSSLSFTIP